jgi:cobalt/nickel transport system permease protein
MLHISVDLVALLRRLAFADSVRAKPGFCGRLTPVAHLVGTVGILVAVALADSVVVVVGLFVGVTLLALQSGVPAWLFAGRVLPVTLLSSVVVLPQVVILEGPPLAGVAGMTATVEGVRYVGTFALRVAASVATVTALVTTTRVPAVTGAARRLGVPYQITTIVEVTYRFLRLSTCDLRAMLVARRSRGGGRTDLKGSWRDLSGIAGTFLLRSLARGERVERAACARGGRNSRPVRRPAESIGGRDVAFLALAAAAVVAALALGGAGWDLR